MSINRRKRFHHANGPRHHVALSISTEPKPLSNFFLLFASQSGFHLIETNEACSGSITMATLGKAHYTKGALLTPRLSIDLSVVKHDVEHIKVIASELVNKLVTF